MTTQLRRFVALLALVVMTSACSNTNPTAPSSAAPAISMVSLTIVSEETKAPLVGAKVTIEKGGFQGITNAEGKVAFESIPSDTRLKIEYDGYLESVTKLKAGNVYGLLGPLDGVSLDFIKEFRFSGSEVYNTVRPRNNRLNIVPVDETMRSPKILAAFERVCAKIRNVGYDCNVYIDTPAPIGTRVSFQYGGEQGATTVVWTGAGTDHAYTIRGSLLGMERDEGLLAKLISPLGLYQHSLPNGAASKTQLAGDFSSWEKRAIRLYMPREEPTCYQDTVMPVIPGSGGGLCVSKGEFQPTK